MLLVNIIKLILTIILFNMESINPIELFGLNFKNLNEKDLKKKYYELALLCHPDKGGNKDEMIIIQKSYEYIKKQIDNCKNIPSYEQSEEDFESFCKLQESQIPDFLEIFKESDDYKRNIEFNKKFEELKKKRLIDNFKIESDEPEPEEPEAEGLEPEGLELEEPEKQNINENLFEKGYGEYMIKSEYNKDNITYNSIIKDLNKQEKEKNIIKLSAFPNILKNELTIYKPLETNQIGCGSEQRFDLKNIDDFSTNINNYNLSDYKNAFTILGKENVDNFKIKEKSLEDFILERQQMFDSIKFD